MNSWLRIRDNLRNSGGPSGSEIVDRVVESVQGISTQFEEAKRTTQNSAINGDEENRLRTALRGYIGGIWLSSSRAGQWIQHVNARYSPRAIGAFVKFYDEK